MLTSFAANAEDINYTCNFTWNNRPARLTNVTDKSQRADYAYLYTNGQKTTLGLVGGTIRVAQPNYFPERLSAVQLQVFNIVSKAKGFSLDQIEYLNIDPVYSINTNIMDNPEVYNFIGLGSKQYPLIAQAIYLPSTQEVLICQ